MSQMRFKDEKGGILISIFRRWKPKGKMYSLRCNHADRDFFPASISKRQYVANVSKRQNP